MTTAPLRYVSKEYSQSSDNTYANRHHGCMKYSFIGIQEQQAHQRKRGIKRNPNSRHFYQDFVPALAAEAKSGRIATRIVTQLLPQGTKVSLRLIIGSSSGDELCCRMTGLEEAPE